MSKEYETRLYRWLRPLARGSLFLGFNPKPTLMARLYLSVCNVTENSFRNIYIEIKLEAD